ncbi:MAG: CpaF family protein [Actinobacteria bacterium]|nr:CpaF family protein [Actinomycetota bacterium]MDA2995722.1 CpaF family protein [Actinomycetota bacterium]
MSLAARFDTKSFPETAVVAEDTPSQQEMYEATSDLNLCALERSELNIVVDSVRTSLQSATREQQLGGEQLRRLAEREVDEALGKYVISDRQQLMNTRDAVLNELLGYGPLQELLNRAEVSEIMVNGHQQIFVERNGRLERTGRTFDSEDHLRAVIDRMVRSSGRRVDQSSPMVDARLPDGSRLNVVLPPLAVDGPSVTIRKFTAQHLTSSDLVERGALSREAAEFLSEAVSQRRNIIVSGGTGTGKTTMLNVLSSHIARSERVVTVEDAVELQLDMPNIIRLESRPANTEGAGAVTIRDLVRNSLRMRPDRIVVGEVRGAEALDMLQAMNTGHDGSLSTLHANNPRDAIRRLETMVLLGGVDLPLRAIREQVASAVDLIVQLTRGSDGARFVSSITEVVGLEGDVVSTAELFNRSLRSAPDRVALPPLVSTGVTSQLVQWHTSRPGEGN